MRRIVVTILSVSAGLAQFGAPLSPFWSGSNSLAEHLKLTPAQLEELSRNLRDYEQSRGATDTEINRLNGEIGRVTEGPDPAAAMLGPLYARIEDLCRRESAPFMNLHQSQMQVLTAEQRGLLKELEDSPSMQSLRAAALFFFLIPDPGAPPAPLPVQQF